jgi:hypothetical protein
MMFKKSNLIRLMNLYPPFFGAGIRLKKVAADFTEIEVEMKLRFWNQNYVGTHFGGSLYSMTDPFYMFMLLENLGRDYIVWDKAASIRFKRPGKGRVHARFELSKEQIESIRKDVYQNGKTEPEFTIQIKDDSGEVIAEVDKVLSIRLKQSKI